MFVASSAVIAIFVLASLAAMLVSVALMLITATHITAVLITAALNANVFNFATMVTMF